ncbi:Rieske 2Fe-2S domain-containing protein [Sphingomonas sp. MMS24-J13]|uniref:Rieske 2Fe-2S domain-containing protein n=1 Tax=Sphingomonas sp. MMS24-J13 TaxID=3238686 RepID=UPI00384E06BA
MSRAAWLRNAWYQAAWSADLAPGALLARTLLDEPVVIFRGREGSPAVLADRCPHRFAPLSMGRIEADGVRCGYHGLAFGGNGHCIANPHGPITRALQVRAYPTIERHGAIWVWMGEDELADPASLPRLDFIDETPEAGRIQGYMPTQANYQLIVDNILDLSHADYLHPTTLGGMMTAADVHITEQEGRVRTAWTALDLAEAPPPFRAQVPPSSNMDIRISVEWQAPATMMLCVTTMPAGTPPTPADESWTLHSMTPETATRTHYFYCATRRRKLDDTNLTSAIRNAIEQAFQREDKPMLEAQQARIGTPDLLDLGPAMLSIDNGAVRARRLLARLIDRESEPRR